MKKIKTKRQRFRLSFPALLILIFCIVIVAISVILQYNKSSYKSRAEGVQSNTQIINGYDAKPSEWPFVARLITREKDKEGKERFGVCTASFVSENWLITAAHCLTDKEDLPINYSDIIIESYNDSKSDRHDLSSSFLEVIAVVTPNGSFPKKDNIIVDEILVDIALVKVSNKTYKLPFISYTDMDISNILTTSPYVAIAGWGVVTEDLNINSLPSKLQENNLYATRFDEYFMALVKKNSQGIQKVGGACTGDSGGPIVANIGNKRYLVGITTACPKGQCGTETYALNIRRFSQWIESTTGVKPNSGAFTRNLPILPTNDRDMWWIKR